MAAGSASAAGLPGVPPIVPDRRRLLGRVAGLLFAVAALGTVPAHNLFRAPDLAGPISVPALSILVLGVVCIILPWHRIPQAWLHAPPVLGTALLGAAVADAGVHGPAYVPFAFVLAAYVAYAFRARLAVAAHLALILACLAAPLVYDPALEPDALARALVRMATLLTVAGAVVALRERVDSEQDTLHEVARRDPLTGVGNYRLLHERLVYEIARHQRSNQPFALLLLDLDDFKLVNDRAGHLAGDRLLRAVADELGATVRAQDTVARQGGDEFAVLAPETTTREAAVLAGRIQQALDGTRVGDVHVGVSVGWAIYPQDGEDRQTLLGTADARQRQAKTERKWRARQGAGRAAARGSRYAAGA